MLAHRTGHQRGDPSNVLVKHDKEHHSGTTQQYSAVTVHREVALLSLMMKEALMIDGQHHATSMNGKNEKGIGKLIRIQAVRQEIT